MNSTLSLPEQIRQILALQNDVIELALQDPERISHYTKECTDLLRQFRYRSIHLPSINMRYGENERGRCEQLLEIAKAIDAHTVVLHPDIVDDFSFVDRVFGSLIAVENMDRDKHFGQTIETLEESFEHLPNARWVFDVNHIFTLDPTMRLADGFYHKFSSRIAHYHLSGFGGRALRHIPLVETKQTIIAQNVVQSAVPVVIESVRQEEPVTLEQEYSYCKNLIQPR